jgi:hypothetical protein
VTDWVQRQDELNLIIVEGQEGVGKSTIVRALLPQTPKGAQIDAEDIGQVNPLEMDDGFFEMLGRNVAVLVQSFWQSGYTNVIAGSFLRDQADYDAFRSLLTPVAHVYLVYLVASKSVRDRRRDTRSKKTSHEWREVVDEVDLEDRTMGVGGADYQYLRIDTDRQSPTDTVASITEAFPAVFLS